MQHYIWGANILLAGRVIFCPCASGSECVGPEGAGSEWVGALMEQFVTA